MPKPPHVMVGLSGGVDSSVAAWLLKEQGYQVSGMFMQNWQDDSKHCSFAQDLLDAQAVCKQLGIPLEIVNFSAEYWERVFQYFLDEYAKYRTPNPDVLCNKEIKFKAFLLQAKKQGADYIATGHYARKVTLAKQHYLLKGLDRTKDQSYFLHLLNQDQLEASIFPLGSLTKTTVRNLAKKAGFKNHAKKDSTGICFIGARKFKAFLSEYLLAKPGAIVDTNDNVLGQHDGLMFYTIGQRQGLKIGGKKHAQEAPWYVASKDIKTNRLVVTQDTTNPWLTATKLKCLNFHWINGVPQLPLQCYAKTRYRQADQACTLDTSYQIIFKDPQWAITPGQSVVLYQGDTCLGGGIIQKALLD